MHIERAREREGRGAERVSEGETDDDDDDAATAFSPLLCASDSIYYIGSRNNCAFRGLARERANATEQSKQRIKITFTSFEWAAALNEGGRECDVGCMGVD